MTPAYDPEKARQALNAAVAAGDLQAAFSAYRELRRLRAAHTSGGSAPIDVRTGNPEYDAPRFGMWLERALDEAEQADRKG